MIDENMGFWLEPTKNFKAEDKKEKKDDLERMGEWCNDCSPRDEGCSRLNG